MKAIIAVIALLVIISITATPVVAQVPPTPTPRPTPNPQAVPVYPSYILDIVIDENSCGAGNDWRGFVRGGLLSGVTDTDPTFPSWAWLNLGGLCYNINTGELRYWFSRGVGVNPRGGGYRIFKVNTTRPTGGIVETACFNDNPIIVRRVQNPVLVPDTDQDYYVFSSTGTPPAEITDRFFLNNHRYTLMVARPDCNFRSDTRWRPFVPNDEFVDEFDEDTSRGHVNTIENSPLLSLGNIVEINSPFRGEVFWYIIWMLAAIGTILGIHIAIPNRPVLSALAGGGAVSVVIIYLSTLPNALLWFVGFYFVALAFAAFFRR